jgi:hypothetical protein
MVDLKIYGFDAAVEFPPNNSSSPDFTNMVKPLTGRLSNTVYNWEIFVECSRHYQKPVYKLFRGVCPSWDDTARRKAKGTVFVNSSPKALTSLQFGLLENLIFVQKYVVFNCAYIILRINFFVERI